MRKIFRCAKAFSLLFIIAPLVLASQGAGAAGSPAASEGGKLFPVVVGGRLIGAYGDSWVEPETMALDGKEIILSEAGQDQELVSKLLEGDLPALSPLIKTGQPLAFYGPEGKICDAEVAQVFITYEGEASGTAATHLELTGYELDWTRIEVGIPAEIKDPFPGPVVRRNEGKGVVFSLGDSLKVSFREENGILNGEIAKDGKAFKLSKMVSIPPDRAPETGILFLDLNGDRSPELIVHDSSPNGFTAVLKLEEGREPALLSWTYAGSE